MSEDNTCYLDRSSVRLLALGRDDADLLKAIDALQIFTKADFTPPLPDREAVAWREALELADDLADDLAAECSAMAFPEGHAEYRSIDSLLHRCAAFLRNLASPPPESGDVREALTSLNFVIEYCRRDMGYGWTAMAAFDRESAAQSYLDKQSTSETWPWIYRLRALSPSGEKS